MKKSSISTLAFVLFAIVIMAIAAVASAQPDCGLYTPCYPEGYYDDGGDGVHPGSGPPCQACRPDSDSPGSNQVECYVLYPYYNPNIELGAVVGGGYGCVEHNYDGIGPSWCQFTGGNCAGYQRLAAGRRIDYQRKARELHTFLRNWPGVTPLQLQGWELEARELATASGASLNHTRYEVLRSAVEERIGMKLGEDDVPVRPTMSTVPRGVGAAKTLIAGGQ